MYNNLCQGQKAIALGYDKKKDPAPKVLATGKEDHAKRIIAIAKEHNIPIHKDSDLAEILILLDINEYIPLEVYSVVAEILTYIYEQNDNKKNRRAQ
ncbi:MAG: EscU/YscU/HrcU family type III secretion system export apparatus switch protein [Rickettsiaceae bacterium]|nr:EscU/YscU/HrcU family type III secretion system export apparatus switch protein [Rickettsiaceae bacterium]